MIKDFAELVPYKVKAAKNGDAWIEVEMRNILHRRCRAHTPQIKRRC